MKDGLSFHNTVKYTLYDENGIVKETGISENQTQDNVLTMVINAIDGGTCSDVVAMAVGTGTGAGVASDNLNSSASNEDTGAGVGSGSPEDTMVFSATFTSITGTVTEAGLFPTTAADIYMMFYDDSLSVALTATDSLQIDWTVSVA